MRSEANAKRDHEMQCRQSGSACVGGATSTAPCDSLGRGSPVGRAGVEVAATNLLFFATAPPSYPNASTSPGAGNCTGNMGSPLQLSACAPALATGTGNLNVQNANPVVNRPPTKQAPSKKAPTIKKKKAPTTARVNKEKTSQSELGKIDGIEFEPRPSPAHIFGPKNMPLMLFIKALGIEYYNVGRGLWSVPHFVERAVQEWHTLLDNACTCTTRSKISYWVQGSIEDQSGKNYYKELSQADALKRLKANARNSLRKCRNNLPACGKGLVGDRDNNEEARFRRALYRPRVRGCLDKFAACTEQCILGKKSPMTIFSLTDPSQDDLKPLLAEIDSLFRNSENVFKEILAEREWQSCRMINNGRYEVLLGHHIDNFFEVLVPRVCIQDRIQRMYPLLQQHGAHWAQEQLAQYISDVALPYASGRHGGMEYSIHNPSFIITFDKVGAQAPHVDMQEGYYNGSLILADGTTPTTMYYPTVDHSINNLNDLVNYATWLDPSLKGKKDPSYQILLFLCEESPALRTEIDSTLELFGNCLLPHALVNNQSLVNCGDICLFPGRCKHAGPATDSFRCILFFAVCPVGSPPYTGDVQWNESSLWGLILGVFFHKLSETMRRNLLNRILFPQLECPDTAMNLGGELREFEP